LSAHLIRWGERTTPLQACDAELAPCGKTALELVNAIRARQQRGRADIGRFASLDFAENRTG